MAKVLISPIGAGRKKARIGEYKKANSACSSFSNKSDREYHEAKYKFNGNDTIHDTHFLVAALAKHLKVDRIIFIGTAKSMWERVYRYFTENAGQNLDYEYWDRIGNFASESNFNNMILDEESLREAMVSVDEYLKAINPSAIGGSLPLLMKYGLNEEELWENFSIFMKLIKVLKDGDEVYLDITHSFRSIPLFMYLMMDFMQTLKNFYLRDIIRANQKN